MAKEDKDNHETYVFDEVSRQYIKEGVDFYITDRTTNDDHHFKSNELDMNKFRETMEKIHINRL